MDYQLRGKTAYVSAGAHGIGEAIADLLAGEGRARCSSATTTATCCARRHTSGTAPLPRTWRPPKGSITPRTSCSTRSAGPPDILINNLGVGNSTPFEDITDEHWARSIDVNLMGTVRTCRALLPHMAARGTGAVVNTGSDLAKQPEPGFIDYGACKAALLYVTKALAKQYAPAVRVNTVLPGPIWSRMWTRPGGIVDQLVAHYGADRDTAVQALPARIGRCRWASASRRTSRTRWYSSPRRWPGSSPAPPSTSAAPSAG